MTDIKPREAWAVVGPDGEIVLSYPILLKEVVLRQNLIEQGYTVQPVTITGRKG